MRDLVSKSISTTCRRNKFIQLGMLTMKYQEVREYLEVKEYLEVGKYLEGSEYLEVGRWGAETPPGVVSWPTLLQGGLQGGGGAASGGQR